MRAEGFVPQRCKGRGGSVSRRDHNQETGIRAQLTGAYSLEKNQLELQLLFGRGGLGERRFS